MNVITPKKTAAAALREKATLAEAVRNSIAPLGAWAPGHYFRTCSGCGDLFCGDKRALQCFPCAAVNEILSLRRAVNETLYDRD